MIERFFETAMWQTRFLVILAVIFGLIGALILFVIGSMDIFGVAKYAYVTISTGAHPENFHEDIVSSIIGAVDLYLIAVVMLIFSFGIYELFISPIDHNEKAIEDDKVLSIKSLDQLKDKIAKVIVMVLVVNFFQRVLHTQYNGALEMLYFALAVTALAVGLYFLGKVGKH
ncbi:YqhA family protein [Candidatus Marinarcus aquaticus]|uniref:YqhA family protein n=1 Tax=Candidatus Marinarcus aquaticus TaxID=2044504 RepID=UPI001D172EF5|nr:YqhA family protein [Candidatus Marinarcus aquaticus]